MMQWIARRTFERKSRGLVALTLINETIYRDLSEGKDALLAQKQFNLSTNCILSACESSFLLIQCHLTERKNNKPRECPREKALTT